MRTSRGRALHRGMYLRNELPGSLARSLLIMTGLLTAGVAFGQGRDPRDQAALPMTRQEVIEQFMRPYAGPRIRGVDTSTLYGKALCGYQGWFTAPGDGSGRGFTHYEDVYVHDFEPGHANIDFWPDVSELGADEKFATPFRHRDGRIAYVYSAQHPKTVMRHFKWMKEYGIDGALLQRFATVIDNPIGPRQLTVFLNTCRAGANANGRAYAVEYTVDRGPQGQMQTIIEDWKLLIDRMKI